MKAQFHKVPLLSHSSYFVRHDHSPQYGCDWHYHPEMELVYIVEGSGERYIGNDISRFAAGEIILLGENLPHVWKYDDEYLENGTQQAEALVIYFRTDCLGKDIFNLQETHSLSALFEKAKSGLLLTGVAKDKVASLMEIAVNATDLERIIILLSILKTISESEETLIVSKQQEYTWKKDYNRARLNDICNYTLSNYKNDISLCEISAVSHLSVTSFCRYFKSMTKKTYYNFLNEVRVSQACKLLIEDRYSTSLICYECGFNNISNFYRHFKKVMGLTPHEYRQKYLS